MLRVPAARAGLLDARVELPLLGVAVGAALALSALVTLGSCAAGLACRRAKPVPAAGPEGGSSPLRRGSGSQHPRDTRLPRQSRSLPPDLRLGDLAPEPRGETPRCWRRGTCGATCPDVAPFLPRSFPRGRGSQRWGRAERAAGAAGLPGAR